MEVPQAAIDLAKRFEGFHRVPKHDPGRAHPYICPAGFWTIGFGHLCEPNHPPITEEEAEDYLVQDLQTALDTVIVDADLRQVVLLWRAFTTLRQGPHDVRAMTITADNIPRPAES